MQKQSPIQAFFQQSPSSDTRVWTWLAVFWFAIMVWLIGQFVFGIPMMIAGMIADPSVMDTVMEAKETAPQENGAFLGIAFGVLAIGALFAFLLYVLRNQFDGSARRTVLNIAAACAIASFAAFVYVIIYGASPEDAEMLNGWLAKSPAAYLFMLLMFPPMAIGLWLGVKFVQRRTILSLHTAHFRFRWGRMVFAMLVVWALAAIMSYGAHVTGISEAEYVFDPSRFWKYLPITLLFIPLQSATEEIALRGYLNQGLGKYIKNPWIVFVITSAAFASLHLGNPEVAETVKEHSIWVAMSGYFMFGIFACIITYIDGGLEAAIGMHAANNMFAAAVVGYDNSALPVPTIFKVGLNTQLDSIMVIVSLSLVCLILYLTRRPLIRPEVPESLESTVFS